MSVGDQQQFFVVVAQAAQKSLYMGAHLNFVAHLFFELANIQLECLGPKIQAVPLQGALMGANMAVKIVGGGFEIQLVDFCVTFGQVLQPEIVVEMEVQQGTIHIQQYSIYSIPVDHKPGSNS